MENKSAKIAYPYQKNTFFPHNFLVWKGIYIKKMS